MNFAKVKAFGSYMPDTIISNDDLSNLVDTSDEWISTRSGIKNRRISTTENTSQLCAKACLDILKNSTVSAEEIDVIIVATMTPDYLTPSTACLVQSLIGAKNAFAFDISAACSGFIYALSVGEKLLSNGAYRNILVVGGETISKTLDWNDRRTCVLFGDGAAGVLLGPGDNEGFLAEDLHSDGDRNSALTAGFVPLSNPFMSESDVAFQKDVGNDRFMKMDGRAIFDFVIKTVPKSLKQVLERGNTTFDQVTYIVPHQANARIIDALAKKLKLDIDKFYVNMEQFGNTSAATIPLALTEMWQNGLIHIGSDEKILLTGFGGGLTWGSLLINL